MECIVEFSGNWINAAEFERALQQSGGPHQPGVYSTTFRFPAGCKVMVDAATRILSLANQLSFSTQRVQLVFEEGRDGAMGYLDRIGFFDCLDGAIEVAPSRPSQSAASRLSGRNRRLVEIARINKDHLEKNLPTRLTEVLTQSCAKHQRVAELGDASWTSFSELIQNIFDHSLTRIDGYAALQVYQQGNLAQVSVSDSGRGIMDTLRPALHSSAPELAQLDDLHLLVEVFRRGISRHGADRGCGLRGCAAKAIKFSADLTVRLPQMQVLLVPARGAYEPNKAYCTSGLPLLWGTHISFGFKLSN